MTLIVTESLNVGTTTVKQISPYRVVIGQVLQIAVKVYIISMLLIYYYDKTKCTMPNILINISYIYTENII